MRMRYCLCSVRPYNRDSNDHTQSILRSRVMNRKKKIKQILTKKMKKANAKLAPKDGKPAYISKADRAAAEAAEDQQMNNE